MRKTLFRLLTFVLMIAMTLTAMPASAWWSDTGVNPETDTSEVILSGECGENVTYELRASGNLFISGTGPMYDYDTSGPWRSFAYDTPMYVYFDSGVTYIGKKAFYYCYCLKRVEFPDTLVEIGDRAFEGAAELQSITLPEGLTSIGDSAFSLCGNPGYDGYDFNEVVLPSTIKTIGANAFNMCYRLYWINLPDGLESIGAGAFASCIWLRTIEMPDTVTSVGQYAFSNCYILQSLRLSDNLQVLPKNMYSANNSSSVALSEITLPLNLKTIETKALSGRDLKTIYIPGNVETIAEKAFDAFNGEIYFYGNAPSFDPAAFVNDVTIYYPKNNDTWDSVVGQNFGSTITWIEQEDGSGGGSGGNAGDMEGDDSDQSGDTGNEGTESGGEESGDGEGSGSEGDSGSESGGGSGSGSQPGSGSAGTAPEVDSNLVFYSSSITLQDDLTVNFKADAALFETYTSPYVVFVQNGIETTVTEYAVEDGYVVFAFADILPNRMNDEITATMYATLDGTVYMSEAKAYSVATYCYNMLDKYSDDEKLRTLLVDILNYGAATQEYTGHNTANLANAVLTDEQKAWASPERDYSSVENDRYEEIANSAVMWIGAGLNLSESIAVRYEFTTASTDGLTAKVTCGGKTWEIAEFSKNEQDKDVLLVYINAGYMSEPIYVTLYDGETAVSDTVCYSIESYASTYGEDAELGALVKAMMKYGDAASAYITKG